MKSLSFLVSISLLVTSTVFTQNNLEYDLVIGNARIVDGTGKPSFPGSIAIKDGKIAKIGRIDRGKSKHYIDAKDRVVAPGFIDVHTHVEDVFDNPAAENFVRMGVTSLVTGNCGGSVTDVAEFFARYREKPLAVNLATLIGHNSIRAKVMGPHSRAPSAQEQSAMNEIVEQAMKDGAVGFSTGLEYVPGMYAETVEIVELAKVASRHGGIYASHIRDEGVDVVAAIKEAINVGEQARMPVEISHFKISAKALWNQSPMTLGLVRSARRRGVKVTVDQYSYPASSTSLDIRLPKWVVAGGRDEGRKRLADPANRQSIAEEMKQDLKKKKFADYSFAYVANYAPDTSYNGKNIAEITKIARGNSKLDTQIEQIFEMYEKGGASMVYQVMSEDDVRTIMREPFTMIASDSGVRQFGVGVPHPRGYGNNARVLGRYVRELKVISLEDAVRKMTSLPAQTFGLRDRGQIREGFAADLVIFDPVTISDKATFEHPHQYAEGVSWVIVNGEAVFDGTKMTGKMPGQPLKRN